MPRCRVSRRCYDINRALVEPGGIALLAPDAKGKLPAWAEPVGDEEAGLAALEGKPVEVLEGESEKGRRRRGE